MIKIPKIISNSVYILTMVLLLSSAFIDIKSIENKNTELTLANNELVLQRELDYANYSETIKEIVHNVQITDSYLFVGGFDQEESAEFNVKRYEDMLTLKSDLNDLLGDTENFFSERSEFFDGLPDIWPFESPGDLVVSSPWGDRYSPITGKIYHHNGMDIVATARTEIIATANGKVVSHFLNHPIFGKYLVIEMENGYQVHYAHLSKSYVIYREDVVKGEKIGMIGNSGISTGIHLHYAISKNGEFLDPASFFRSPPTIY
jgi:murein DD-endopeptidase MepM/ murein hydrolase activator NlpD